MLPDTLSILLTSHLLFLGTDFLLGSLIILSVPGQADFHVAQTAVAVCTRTADVPTGLKFSSATFSKSFGSQNPSFRND